MGSKCDIQKELKSAGYEFIHDTNRDLYIIFDRKGLKNSIFNIRQQFDGSPADTQEGCNCTNMDAQSKIDIIERIIHFLMTDKDNVNIFDYLPYTKDGKFSKSSSIILFRPDIKDTWSGEYFSQYETVLLLEPYTFYDDCYNPIKLNNIVQLELTTMSLYGRKSVDNIIDEKCNFIRLAPAKRNSYLKNTELNVGTSYDDAKGNEYLFLGFLPNYNSSISLAFIKVTNKLKKEMEQYSTFYDFLYAFLSKVVKDSSRSDYNVCNVFAKFNISASKKFVKPNTVYFDDNHNQLHAMTITLPMYSDKSVYLANGEPQKFLTKTVDLKNTPI